MPARPKSVRDCVTSSLVIVAGLLAVSPAWPQAVAPTDQARTLVVDFVDHTGYADGALSARAADALTAALDEGLAFKPISMHEVRLEAAARRYKPPLSQAQAQVLGTALGADVIVTGEVLLCQVHEQQTSVHVVLEASVHELDGEEPLLVASGVGRAGWQAAEEALVDARVSQALSGAAKQIAEAMGELRMLVGMVYLSLGRQRVMLDLGSVHGVRKGVVFRVYRRVYDRELKLNKREFAGRVKVTHVDTDSCTARIIMQNGAITTADTVRAIVPPKPTGKGGRKGASQAPAAPGTAF